MTVRFSQLQESSTNRKKNFSARFLPEKASGWSVAAPRWSILGVSSPNPPWNSSVGKKYQGVALHLASEKPKLQPIPQSWGWGEGRNFHTSVQKNPDVYRFRRKAGWSSCFLEGGGKVTVGNMLPPNAKALLLCAGVYLDTWGWKVNTVQGQIIHKLQPHHLCTNGHFLNCYHI